MVHEIVESEYVVDPTVSLTPPTPTSLWDAERQRRLRILQILNSLGAVGAVLLLGVLALVVDQSSPIRTGLILGVVALLVLLGVSWMLARAGKLEAGAHVLFGGMAVLLTIIGAVTDGSRSHSPYVLFVPVVGATLLLAPRWSFGYALGVRLLGTQSILVGIQADTAQTMAGLGLDLDQIVIRRDLQSGLEYALQAPLRQT